MAGPLSPSGGPAPPAALLAQVAHLGQPAFATVTQLPVAPVPAVAAPIPAAAAVAAVARFLAALLEVVSQETQDVLTPGSTSTAGPSVSRRPSSESRDA